MELTVKNNKGKDTTNKVALHEGIYAITPNDNAIYLDVKQHMANKRQGTHKTKEKGEVNFSTRKIKKQKGTGGARAGSLKSPIFVGGGTTFGPKPRKYNFKLNKQLKQLARKSALTYKAKKEDITIIEDLDFKEPKTKKIVELLSKLDLLNKKTLLVLGESNKNIYLSARNFQKINVIIVSQLNTYDIMNAQKVVFFESAIKKVETQFKK